MGNILLRSNSGGSTTLTTDDAQTQDLTYTVFPNDIESRVLSGAELTAVGLIGTQVGDVLLWANGDITGETTNGKFTKSANGDLECRQIDTVLRTTSGANGNLFSVDFNLTYPIVFTSVPVTSYYSERTNGGVWGANGVGTPTTEQARCRLFGVASTSQGYGGYVAKGVWK